MFESLNDELITIEAMIGNLWSDVDFIPPEAFVSPVRIVATTPVIGNIYGPILVKFDVVPLFHVYFTSKIDETSVIYGYLITRDKVVANRTRIISFWDAIEKPSLDSWIKGTLMEMVASEFAKMGIMVSFHFPVNWY